MPVLKLPGGSLRDEIREPLYDSIDLSGNVSTVNQRFFASVQGKTLAQTNLRTDSRLEVANSFRMMGMAIDVQNFTAANAAAIPRILENSSLELRIGEKLYWQGPMRFISGRLWTDVAGSGAAAVYQQHGFAAVAPVILVGKHTVDINPLQTFEIKWVMDTLATPIALAQDTILRYVGSLKGLRRRPVQ